MNMIIGPLLAVSVAAAVPRRALEGPWEGLKAQASVTFDGLALKASLQGEGPMALSELAERLARDPVARKAVLDALEQASQSPAWPGPAPLSPADRARLEQAMIHGDKDFLDSFPKMTVPEIKAFITKYAASKGPLPAPAASQATEPLGLTGQPALPAADAFLQKVVPGVWRGDKATRDAATAYGDNRRVADVLNQLALNAPGQVPTYRVMVGPQAVDSVESFITALRGRGHALTVKDMRYFANFGDLWAEENGDLRSVMTPLLVKTGLRLPGGKEFLVPITHSHIEINLRGPAVNVNLTFFFGVDGSSQFNPIATENQPWVNERLARRWDGDGAAALLSRAATLRRELAAKVAQHGLPMGGYGALGGCNDVTAMVTGAPIYPMVRDPKYYRDGMTIDAWANALPIDDAQAPDLERLWDSLPTHDPDAVMMPAVREQVLALKKLLGK